MEFPYMLFGICFHPSKLSLPSLTSSSAGTYFLCVADSIMATCEGRSTNRKKTLLEWLPDYCLASIHRIPASGPTDDRSDMISTTQ